MEVGKALEEWNVNKKESVESLESFLKSEYDSNDKIRDAIAQL